MCTITINSLRTDYFFSCAYTWGKCGCSYKFSQSSTPCICYEYKISLEKKYYGLCTVKYWTTVTDTIHSYRNIIGMAYRYVYRMHYINFIKTQFLLSWYCHKNDNCTNVFMIRVCTHNIHIWWLLLLYALVLLHLSLYTLNF